MLPPDHDPSTIALLHCNVDSPSGIPCRPTKAECLRFQFGEFASISGRMPAGSRKSDRIRASICEEDNNMFCMFMQEDG